MGTLYQSDDIPDNFNVQEFYRLLLSYRKGNEPYSEILITSFSRHYNDFYLPGINDDDVELVVTSAINMLCNNKVICDRAWDHREEYRCVNLLWEKSAHKEWTEITKNFKL